MLRPADIWRLHPDEYEFLWRSMLRKEHGQQLTAASTGTASIA
jgi:hypothetical protein